MRIKCKEGKEEGMKEARIQEGKERKEGGNIEGHIERKRQRQLATQNISCE